MEEEEHAAPVSVSRRRKLFGGFVETLGVYLIWASAFTTAIGLIVFALHRTRPGESATSDGLLWLAVSLGWPVLLFGVLVFLVGFALWGIGARLTRRGGRPYTP